MNPTPTWQTLCLGKQGRSLIEASAGTGKTWTITALHLRLLLERELPARRIVVATYTEAAAAELKERLRLRIEQALSLSQNPTQGNGDPVTLWLQQRWQSEPQKHQQDAEKLALALAELDIAPIGTLHSLCLRILAEHPFAAGGRFETPALSDGRSLQRALADDLWRLLHEHSTDPQAQALRQPLHAVQNRPDRKTLDQTLKLLLQAGVSAPAPEPQALAHPASDPTLAEDLRQQAKRRECFRTDARLPRQMMLLADLIAHLDSTLPLPELAGFDGAATLLDSIRARKGLITVGKKDPALGAVLDRTAAFLTAFLSWQAALRQAFLHQLQHWATAQYAVRLTRAGQLGFDDLLQTVRCALEHPQNGPMLAQTLRQAWPVALIDEFQDTDPTQYAILDTIWSRNQNAHLLLIGDPKQAIYRFRGGDIHTYTRARQSVPASARMSLAVNYRSDQAYVEAIDAWYRCVGHTLGDADSDTEIAFVPVQAARQQPSPLQQAGRPVAALRLHDPVKPQGTDDTETGSDSKGKQGTTGKKSTATDETRALLSCASRIVELLSPDQGWSLNGKPLQASDLCVLVPKNDQAQRLTGHLRERGVAVVNRGRADVFQTQTARDLLLVLDAVLHCHQPGRIRAALATALWGLGYHQLHSLNADSRDWQTHVENFHHWQQLWLQRGVLSVIMQLQHTLSRAQLAQREGERTLTDLRHLGELLQDAERDSDGPQALLAWLRERIEGESSDQDNSEASVLRLESDAHCVQIMTLHASKGLEFPIVLLPLMWTHKASTQNTSRQGLLTQPDGGRQLVFDPQSLQHLAREEQDERHRVLYVALTRARHACEVWLDQSNDRSDTSPLHQITPALRRCTPLLDADAQPSPAALLQRLPGWPAISNRRLEAEATSAPGTLQARPLPPERRGPLPARHSFSTLTAQAPSGLPDSAAEDEADTRLLPPEAATPQRTPHPELDALSEIAGEGFGNAVHAILELRQVGTPLQDQLDLIARQLHTWGALRPELSAEKRERRVQALARRLDAVLDADLDGRGLRLAELPLSALRCEMEFRHLLPPLRLSRLRAACAEAGEPDLVPPHERLLCGLMNGKIDLLFRHQGRIHVLDWKSNRLGPPQAQALQDYAGTALDQAMDAHHYRFQALLYSLALERHLRARLGAAYQREQHRGDAWYLFVRATGLHLPDGRACGIWHQRFSDALLDAAHAALSTASLDLP